MGSLHGMFFNYRLKHGMHWKKSYPFIWDMGSIKKMLLFLLAIALSFNTVVSAYAEVIKKDNEVHSILSWKEAYNRVLLACLNRGGFRLGNKTFLCDAVEI